HVQKAQRISGRDGPRFRRGHHVVRQFAKAARQFRFGTQRSKRFDQRHKKCAGTYEWRSWKAREKATTKRRVSQITTWDFLVPGRWNLGFGARPFCTWRGLRLAR